MSSPVVDQSALLKRLRPLLRSYANTFLPAAERRHAEDLAQEAWIQVWRVLGSYPGDWDDERGLTAWCMAVGRNRMRNWVNERLAAPTHGERQSRLYSDYDLIALVEAGEQFTKVQDSYHDGRVREAVDALPPGQREYVIARFWHGESTTSLQQRMPRSTWTRLKPKLAAQLQHLVT